MAAAWPVHSGGLCGCKGRLMIAHVPRLRRLRDLGLADGDLGPSLT
jgi:hypothetical protein